MSKNGKKQGGIILKKYNKIIGLLLAVALLLPGMATKVSAAENDVTRLAGDNRIETSIKISKDAYANGSAAEVVLAGWEGKADALTGTYLASAKKAPLLFTRGGSLDTDLLEELERLGAKTVYVLGGTTVINNSVVTALEAKGMKVERVDGKNRFETAAAVAKKVNASAKHVFLAYGWGELPDALAAGPASAKEGMPVLLTENKVDETAAALKNLGVEKVTILGGTTVVSKAIEDKLVADLGAANVNRVSGLDRFETANAIAAKYFVGSTKAIVANSNPDNNPDALVAGYFGAMKNAPILLTPTTALHAKTAAYLKANVKEAYIVGGTTAVNATVEADVKTAITPVVGDLAVVSVSAINGKEVEIKFNKAVDKTTVISTGSPDTLKNITITPVGTANGISALAPTLSADGKTLTVMADKTDADKYFDGKYAVVVDELVKDLEGNKIKAYTEVLTVKDTVRPTVEKVGYTDNKTAVITFSEPLESLGTVTSSDSKVTAPTLLAKGDRTITVDLTNAVVNKDYTLSIVGAKDFAGNLISPNPAVVTVKKDDSDKVAPTVNSITPTSPTSFSIKFSEKIVKKAGFGDIDITVGSANVGTKAVVDSKDATIVNVTGISAVTGIQNITIAKDAFEDLSGNKLEVYTELINFSKDTVKPVVASTEVKTINKANFLIINFNEEIALTSGNAVFTTKKANGETDTKTVPHGSMALYNVDANGKSKSIQIPLATLASDETYTGVIDAGLVKDNFNNPNALVKDISVKVPGALVVVQEMKNASTANVTLVGPSSTVKANSVLKVEFKYELDVASAENKANYAVEGATVEKAEINQNSSNNFNVYLTLAKGSVKLDGTYRVTVQNVKAKDGLALEKTYIENVILKENIAPTVVSAKFTGVSAGNVDKITLEFSEEVKTADSQVGLFEVFIGDSKVPVASTANESMTTAGNKVVLTITDETLTPAQIAKGITIKFKDGEENKITDIKGNILDFTSIIATY